MTYDNMRKDYERMRDAERTRLVEEWKAANGYDDLLAAYSASVSEADRLRKLFDDAGQGEHNVLALIDHYQRNSMLVQKLRAERDAAYELEKAKADAEARAYLDKWQREREEANAEALRRSQDKRGIAKEAREREKEERRKREEAYAAANPFVMVDTSRPRREAPRISGPDWRQGGRTVLLTLKGAPWKSNGHVALSDAVLASPAGLSTSKAIAESQTKQPTIDKGARLDEMMRGKLVAFRDTRRAIVDTIGARKKLQGVYRSDSGTIRRVDLGYDPPETLYSVDADAPSPMFDAPTVDAVRYMVMPMRLDGAEEKRLRAALADTGQAAAT